MNSAIRKMKYPQADSAWRLIRRKVSEESVWKLVHNRLGNRLWGDLAEPARDSFLEEAE